MAEFVKFVFSIGGLTCLLFAALVWTLARRTSRAPRMFMAIVIVFYTMISIFPVPGMAARYLSSPYRPFSASDAPAGKTVVVILGSGSFTAHDWYDHLSVSFADPAGANRVVEAARVYNLIHPDLVISSGGAVGRMDRLAPAGKVMADLLERLGVPAARILVETESRNTHDEGTLVKRMLEPLNVDHVVLVTSDIHMRRSVGVFRAAGLTVIPAIARDARSEPPWNIALLPSSTGIEEFQDVIHEVGGIAYYRLRGWYR